MNDMFQGAAAFDQDLNAWDVSKVTSITSMFEAAAAFDQDLSAWDVSNIRSGNVDAAFYNTGMSNCNKRAIYDFWPIFGVLLTSGDFKRIAAKDGAIWDSEDWDANPPSC